MVAARAGAAVGDVTGVVGGVPADLRAIAPACAGALAAARRATRGAHDALSRHRSSAEPGWRVDHDHLLAAVAAHLQHLEAVDAWAGDVGEALAAADRGATGDALVLASRVDVGPAPYPPLPAAAAGVVVARHDRALSLAAGWRVVGVGRDVAVGVVTRADGRVEVVRARGARDGLDLGHGTPGGQVRVGDDHHGLLVGVGASLALTAAELDVWEVADEAAARELADRVEALEAVPGGPAGRLARTLAAAVLAVPPADRSTRRAGGVGSVSPLPHAGAITRATERRRGTDATVVTVAVVTGTAAGTAAAHAAGAGTSRSVAVSRDADGRVDGWTYEEITTAPGDDDRDTALAAGATTTTVRRWTREDATTAERVALVGLLTGRRTPGSAVAMLDLDRAALVEATHRTEHTGFGVAADVVVGSGGLDAGTATTTLVAARHADPPVGDGPRRWHDLRR